MPKRVRWLNNERADIPDFEAGTNGGSDATAPGFAEAVARQHLERFVLDNYPSIAEGFRVEVSDQAASPGEFSVHNGFAHDRVGAAVEDESSIDSSITTILPAVSTQYFVEVEFVLTETDTDARAFWDPSYDNGTDPSGDDKMPGKEFNLNVATRWAPTWQIVSPISTTGFQVGTNPNSLRIPVAVLETDLAGAITNIASANQTARSTVRVDAPIASLSLKLHNTRLMQDAFTLRVATWDGAAYTTEDLTVTANDRANGVLTLGIATAAAHYAGDAAYDVTVATPEFMAPRATSPMPSTGSADARPLFWQGDTIAGYAAIRDPNSNTAMVDTEIAALKQAWNALAAQIRDMKFGGFLDWDTAKPQTSANVGFGGGVGTVASQPKWVDRAGGILPSRSVTVTVGTGTDSWGDFNVTACGSFDSALTRAVTAAGTNGTVVIKKSATAYQFTKPTVTITSADVLTIRGEAPGVTIEVTQNVPALTIVGGSVVLENLRIKRGAGCAAAVLVDVTTAATVTMDDCVIEGFRANAAAASTITARNCTFSILLNPGGSTGHGFDAKMTRSRFDGCTFATAVNAAGSRGLLIRAGSSLVDMYATTGGMATVLATATFEVESSCSDIRFFGAEVTSLTSTAVAFSAGEVTRLVLERCRNTLGSGLLTATDADYVWLKECVVSFGQDARGVGILQSGGATVGHRIEDCVFTQTASGGARIGIGLEFQDIKDVKVKGNRFIDCDTGIYASASAITGLSVVNTEVISDTASRGIVGINISGTVIKDIVVDDATIRDLDSALNTKTVYGVLIVSASVDSRGIAVRNVRCSNLGSATCATAYGVRFEGPMDDVTLDDASVYDLDARDAAGVCEAFSFSIGGAATGPTNVSVRDARASVVTGLLRSVGLKMGTFFDCDVSACSMTNVGADSGGAVVCTGNSWGYSFGEESTGTNDMHNLSIKDLKSRLIASTAAVLLSTVVGIRLACGRNVVIDTPVLQIKGEGTSFYGIYATSTGGANDLSNVSIVNPMIEDVGTVGGMGIGVFATSADDGQMQIRGGIISECLDGIQLSTIAASGLSMTTVDGAKIRSDRNGATGIRFAHNASNQMVISNVSVSLTGAGGTGAGIHLDASGTSSYATISNTNVSTNSSGAAVYAVIIEQIVGMMMANNVQYDANDRALDFNSGPNTGVITGNYARGPGGAVPVNPGGTVIYNAGAAQITNIEV